MTNQNPRKIRLRANKKTFYKFLPLTRREESEIWKWWNEKRSIAAVGRKWCTLEHNGPVFAPEYQRLPGNVKFYYDGQPYRLSKRAEEVAGFYAKMLDDKFTKIRTFNQNFFWDWREVMTDPEKRIITDFSKCDFREIRNYYKEVERKKNVSDRDKLEKKAKEEHLRATYGHCIVDGHQQKIINFKLEPPGLFRGRGKHPKMGKLKQRVEAEDVTINIGPNAVVPKPPLGHQWGGVIHNNTVSWLARWTDNIFGMHKYIMLNPCSQLKGEGDIEKFERARRLKNHISRIRKSYVKDLSSEDMSIRQRAVALYFIDRLALRTGNEKGEDTADTVGCCSLRVEHLKLSATCDRFLVHFNFPGKDSIPFNKCMPVDERVFRNLQIFQKGKKRGCYLFDYLNPTKLNKYLNETMEGLTVKVFRTYYASKELESNLQRLTKANMSLEEKILAYNAANRAVAVLCNHRRAVPKTYIKSLRKIEKKMNTKLKQVKELVYEMKQMKIDRGRKKKLIMLKSQLAKLQLQACMKKGTKDIALVTSKTNYVDPRITVAWCKKWGVPVEKIYNRTQRERFQWAIETTDCNFKF